MMRKLRTKRIKKSERKLPEVVSVDVLTAIFNHKPKDNFEVRDAAICELFYSSGLRLSELANLNYTELNIKLREVHIINGKGGKSRLVPLGESARDALILWNKARINMRDIDKKAVFISRLGTRLSTRQIKDRAKAYGRAKIEFDVSLHPHKLRHSMATHVLESSHDIRAVQELLGHVDISTTEIYTYLDFGILAKAYDNTHPRAKKKK